VNANDLLAGLRSIVFLGRGGDVNPVGYRVEQRREEIIAACGSDSIVPFDIDYRKILEIFYRRNQLAM
jgi:hypothetical protein